MYSIYSVAKWFLEQDCSMGNKKLQKLCWYSYSWYIAISYNPESKDYDNLIIDSTPEAWVHGPVFSNLFKDYKYDNYFLVKNSEEIKNFEAISFLNEIYQVYGGFTGNQLESISHQEKPWTETREGLQPYEPCQKIIDTQLILEEYLPRIQGN